jgi:hypothetical protein
MFDAESLFKDARNGQCLNAFFSHQGSLLVIVVSEVKVSAGQLVAESQTQFKVEINRVLSRLTTAWT